MSGPADISAILAAIAGAQSTPSQTPAHAPPPQPVASGSIGLPQGYPGVYPTPTPPQNLPGYGLPQPTNSGSVDLSSIKPVSTGSVSIADALAKARNIAAEKGLQPYEGRSSTGPRDDPRLAGRPYRRSRSRSRSRSPPRRDNYRDSYNPYRDERRDDPRRAGYGRERSRSPRGRNTFSPPRGYGARDKTPPRDDDSEVITIESQLVGLVIGRAGENLRRIEQDTGTRIQFITGPESGGPQRQCKITGYMRARADAKREIFRIIEENGGKLANDPPQAGRNARQKGNQPALREGENSVQIMVPDRTVGLIIGRQGETIRDLQERSGCHVNIVGENKSINGLRPVNLIGSREAASKAKELILEIVESDTRPSGPQPKEFGRGGGGGGGGATFEPPGGNKINDSITVPSEAVGMIIGKGGETIKEMQNTTGCKINVSQASGADIEREIGLVGTRQAIEDAKRAIWDKVDTVVQREKNGGAGGRGGGRGRDADPYSDPYSQRQQQTFNAQPAGMPAQAAGAPAGGDAGAADPYAPYGGYQAYMAMWYTALAQQQAAQGQTPGQQPPGA
ncbi:hypothetical protein K490DRAFT_71557 [Saccharata proteae CBS 121410]|uniref:K Homology domain-containing protein n=1 Tax=Saccharata proteae CBS 121410 TaxID=1314787 RepID=A0A9P4LWQ5_9PEZI|nr:hypothetical protein K490DRAFT_71557 [Saccharata proteae CBS 121410]